MQLWGGRFSEKLDDKAFLFNESLSFDRKMYKQDILGSIAHAKMLSKQNIIDKNDAEKIVEGLKQILSEIENLKNKNEFFENDNIYEDIHSIIEAKLIEKIGDAGKKLHTARSRNDQVALDMKLWTRDNLDSMKNSITKLLETIDKIINDNKKTFMPGFTHMQKAQPITLAHHFSTYKYMFERDLDRLVSTRRRTNKCPLGSCALAGTTYNIDREFVAKELLFDGPTENSLDSVSDRDYLIEYIFDLSMIMMHMSRLCEEIIMWNSNEYRFINISDKYSTGSSIMPQKKNPDMAELIRGKTGRVYGNLFQLLTVMKSLPLAYNKDMQEDKQISFDTMETVLDVVEIMDDMLKNISFNKDVMENSCKKGFINATDVADYLVKKGVAFRDAHEMVGKLVILCEKNNISLDELPLEEYNKICNNKIDKDIYEVISIETCVKNRKSFGGTGDYNFN